MEQGLMAMVTAKTKQHLVMKNTEALLTGAPLQFDDLLKQAKKFEKNCNEVPMMTLLIWLTLPSFREPSQPKTQNSMI